MVTTGKEKGKTGKVIAVWPPLGKALVEKLNLVKRHQRPTAKLKQGGIIEKEAPIALSNLMAYCSRCSKGVRVGVRFNPDGEKVRICRRCKEPL